MQELQRNSGKDALSAFFCIVKDDARLSSTHMSIYFVLFSYWIRNDYVNPFNITRRAVMQKAKIKSIVTYHKCIKELDSLGYIKYQPSYHPGIGSKVYLRLN
ncbi:MAG: hypothetical protein BGO69_14630 [Bacteroidetes bacterium 46-16]|nr:MAG: hypothetical protein BGO69_14630 [Bacteroidetes bacterium 46-16]